MLIERRAYTMRPGRMEDFIAAQFARGFGPPMSRVLDRLIGYFRTVSGPTDQMVHLWRFDGFDDWTARLHGLYGRPELEPYFKTVRSLMLAQENAFLVPAPLPQLTPYWGNGNDWLAEQGPRLAAAEATLVEETAYQLLPGTLPAFWDSLRQEGLRAEAAGRHLFGAFHTTIGQLHRVLIYRRYAGLEQRLAHRAALRADPAWQSFERRIGAEGASATAMLLQPIDGREMSPFFSPAS